MKNIIRLPRDPLYYILRKEVMAYLENNNISKYGGWRITLKAIIMIGTFLSVVTILYIFNPAWYFFYLLWVVLGITMAGIGMGVMHDANHESFSRKKWINKIMGATIYGLAGNAFNWKAQHNVLHHTYTNIDGHDEDLDAGRVLRLSRLAKWYSYHRLQKYSAYIAGLYSLLTINWVITADFAQVIRFSKDKRVSGIYPKKWIAGSSVAIGKIFLIGFWFVLPIILGIFWVHVLLGFLVMHIVAGSILSHIFELAHVNDQAKVFDESQVLPRTEHQLTTTVNFCAEDTFFNKCMRWYTGGLTNQVEHHLFPNISHVHYQGIKKIVKKFAQEHDLPYLEKKGLLKPLKEHYTWLKGLSIKPTKLKTT